ncbi:unnamed protein product, partial [Rangifer tarandus platyrhynchus]
MAALSIMKKHTCASFSPLCRPTYTFGDLLLEALETYGSTTCVCTGYLVLCHTWKREAKSSRSLAGAALSGSRGGAAAVHAKDQTLSIPSDAALMHPTGSVHDQVYVRAYSASMIDSPQLLVPALLYHFSIGILSPFSRQHACAHPQSALWGSRWLLFRLLVGSCLTKLRSKSNVWRDFTVFDSLYATQPLPNPFSWYLHQEAHLVHATAAVAVLIVECVAGFMLLLPVRSCRLLAACAHLLLQLWCKLHKQRTQHATYIYCHTEVVITI